MFKKKNFMGKTLMFLLAVSPLLLESRISLWAFGEPQVPTQYKK